MSNCPPRQVKKAPCKKPSKCNGVYSELDKELVTGKIQNSSSLLYSIQPYQCPPTTTCLDLCIDGLPNIPKESYNIYSKAFPGLATVYNESNDFMSNTFNNQCPLKN